MPAITSATQIGIAWTTSGTSNGGTPVIDYKISVAKGTGSYSTLETGWLTTSYTAIGLETGKTYSFQI